MSIKVSQSLSKTLLFDLCHHTCNTTLAAQDGVIQLGKDIYPSHNLENTRMVFFNRTDIVIDFG